MDNEKKFVVRVFEGDSERDLEFESGAEAREVFDKLLGEADPEGESKGFHFYGVPEAGGTWKLLDEQYVGADEGPQG